MSPEENPRLPATQSADPVISAGLEIAMKWGTALGGPEKLEVAFKALEPQLKREHQIRLRQLDNQRAQAERDASAAQAAAERTAAVARAEAERVAQEADRRRNHIYRMSGLICGVVICLALLGSGVAVAPDQPWLATLLCGPSLLALVKIFVLRRSDVDDIRATSRASRDAASASAPPPAQPPAPPVP
ncbi:hypothetical protein [Streptomyces sp. NPDC090026]|uniref:hypothetical protein n=1 Tax=Streptomyces sp. NPDC090026 TaxID=3365923 RepID=UPI0037FDC264